MPSPYDVVIPAYPYEGALYFLLDDTLAKGRQRSRYYGNLYGRGGPKLRSRAGALTALFARIVFASADVGLPDVSRFLDGGIYDNPELGIVMDWRTSEWAEEYKSIVRLLLDEAPVQRLIARYSEMFADEFATEQFLYRLALQVDVARKHSGVLLGDRRYQLFYDAALETIARELGFAAEDEEQRPLVFRSKELSVLGLEFAPANLDAFAEIRSDDAIRRYGVEWREAIASATTTESMTAALLDAMERAMEFEQVSRRAGAAFETTCSFATIAGLIPGAGTIASAVGIAADASARSAKAITRDASWWLVGSRMSEIAVRTALQRRRERRRCEQT